MSVLITKSVLTSSISVSYNTYGNLIPTVNFTLLIPTTVQFQTYNVLDPSITACQFQVDGNDVLDFPGGQVGLLAMALAAGSHTFDYLALSSVNGYTTTTRGLTVVNLDLL